jgi:hypothetical protein
MMKRSMLAVAILSAGFMVGCGSSTPPATQPTTQAEAPKIPIPPDSPLAKIKEGMGYDEVVAAIGQPTTPPYYYQTGKAWIPFHYGGDNYRLRAHWKGQGSITFSSNGSFTSGSSVMEVDYDPNDKGFEPGT